MKNSVKLLAIGLICNSVSDISHTQTIRQLKQDITVLQNHNAKLQDDIQCLRNNVYDKEKPCVSTIGVSNGRN